MITSVDVSVYTMEDFLLRNPRPHEQVSVVLELHL